MASPLRREAFRLGSAHLHPVFSDAVAGSLARLRYLKRVATLACSAAVNGLLGLRRMAFTASRYPLALPWPMASRAEGIWMPPVFSAQAAGSIPHCAADRDGQRYLSTWLALDTQPATWRFYPLDRELGVEFLKSAMRVILCTVELKFSTQYLARQG